MGAGGCRWARGVGCTRSAGRAAVGRRGGAGIKLGSNAFANSRKSAHIDARYHRLRHEVVDTRALRFVYVPTADQAADALTKPLPAPAVRRFQLAMSGAVPLPLPDLSGPPGRIGVSVLEPRRFPTLAHV